MESGLIKTIVTAMSPIVREYNISGTRYIVTASVKTGANEDAAAKVRRLLRKEVAHNAAGH